MCYHDTILDGERIIWQASNQPLPHPYRLAQNSIEGEDRGAGDASCCTKLHKLGSDSRPVQQEYTFSIGFEDALLFPELSFVHK